MQNLIEQVKFFLDDRHLLEMANLQPKYTGVPAVIHISGKGGAKHAARIKVSNIAGTYDHSDNFSVTIDDHPRIIGKCKLAKSHIDLILKWVKLNNRHLHKIWNESGEMSHHDVYNGLKHLK